MQVRTRLKLASDLSHVRAQACYALFNFRVGIGCCMDPANDVLTLDMICVFMTPSDLVICY